MKNLAVEFSAEEQWIVPLLRHKSRLFMDESPTKFKECRDHDQTKIKRARKRSTREVRP
jgi:hypothetical protein